MIWVALLSGSLALALAFFNVQPVWLQYVVFGASLSFFVLYLLSGRETAKVSGSVGSWVQKRRSVLAVFLLLAVGSFLARRYEMILDLSQYKSYSLRDQTISWLKEITEPVQIMIFLQNDDKTINYAEWLQKQANQHTPNVKVEIKNINREILLTQQYNVIHTGETILVTRDNWVKINSFGEKELVTGLIRLLSKTTSSVCFLTGQDEPDIFDSSQQGVSHVNALLKNLGYTTQTVALDLMGASAIEKDCGVLLIISPKKGVLPVEAERLATLMKNEKLPLFFALDPPVSEDIQQALLNEGVVLNSQLVVNSHNSADGIPETDIILYPESIVSPIVKNVTEKFYFPTVQSLSLTPVSSTPDAQEKSLLWQSFIATPPNGKFHLIGGEKQSEALLLAAHAVNQDGEAKRLVWGSGKPFLPRPFDFGHNQQLLLGSLSWLLGEEQLGWIDAREKDEVYMKLSEREETWLKNISIYVLPGTAFSTLFFFWLKRRVQS